MYVLYTHQCPPYGADLQHFTLYLRAVVHRPGMHTKVPQANLFIFELFGAFPLQKKSLYIQTGTLTHQNTPKLFFLLSQVSQVFLRGPSTSVPLTVRIDWYLRIWGGWVSQQPPLQAHLAVNKYFFTNSGPLFITGTPGSQLGLFFSPLYLFFTGSLTQKLVLYEILTYPQILPHLHGKLIAPSLLVSWTEFEDR